MGLSLCVPKPSESAIDHQEDHYCGCCKSTDLQVLDCQACHCGLRSKSCNHITVSGVDLMALKVNLVMSIYFGAVPSEPDML